MRSQAGLFSAVISAFLVAAYPALQPNSSDVIVYTLQRLTAQTASYRFDGTTLTTTNVLPLTLPPSKPSGNAIRVNTLWFASLIVSLVAASFGMLVKQWLREFLAVGNPSPQARLRIRHHRAPQLESWKIYEIAATLPLLLQLSLALFFFGLCYFTAAIHTSIGYTTIPLVIGWILIFFTATLLPVFFPRCPYKTALLKVAAARLHRSMSQWARSCWDRLAGTNANLIDGLRAQVNRPPRWLWRVIDTLRQLPDEFRIVRDDDHDLDILASVDAIQANDELLATAISEAVRSNPPGWTDALHFTVQLLVHRTPPETTSIRASHTARGVWPFPNLFPFSSSILRPKAAQAILRILCDSLMTVPLTFNDVDHTVEFRVDENQSGELFHAFCLLISASYSYPDLILATSSSSASVISCLRMFMTNSVMWKRWWHELYPPDEFLCPLNLWPPDTDESLHDWGYPLAIIAKLVRPLKLNCDTSETQDIIDATCPPATSYYDCEDLPPQCTISVAFAHATYSFAVATEECQRIASEPKTALTPSLRQRMMVFLADALMHAHCTEMVDRASLALIDSWMKMKISEHELFSYALQSRPCTDLMLDVLLKIVNNRSLTQFR